MTRRQLIDDLTAYAVPEQPALSPDGRSTVYVLRTVDAEADRTVRALWRTGPDGREPRPLTRGPGDAAPAWSPDGTRIAFLRAQDGPAQVWSLPLDGGEPEQLTTLALGAGAPLWSPDGTKIAFSAATDLLATASDDDAARKRRAAAPIVIDRLDYQADGAGLLRTIRKHLFVLDVATGECRQVTSGDWHAGDPAWSPDSTTLAYGAATAADADLRPRAPVYTIDVTDRAASPRLAGLADGVAGTVGFTADGASLLVVGMTGAPVGHARLLSVPLDGGEPVDLSGPLDRNVMPGGPGYPGALPRLTADGRTVLFCARDRGCTHLYAVPVTGGTPRPVVTGAGRGVAAMAVAGDAVVVVLVTPMSVGELVAVDAATGAETVLTDHGANLADIELLPRVAREFTISDGTVVEGWLIRDPAATGPQPLLLDIHGGPHNAWNGAADEVHLYHQELAASGWTVLLLNPRGSDGYGERFHDAAVGAWGVADAKDFLEAIDALVADGTADPARLAVTGYSYGGYMTCYLTSRDGRFAAAVPGGLIGDLTSASGTSDVGHFLAEHEFGGAAWAQGERYAASSPLTGIDRVRTPTLILHGAADVRCPVGQAEQWHAALRAQGVPTRLVLYPDSSHLFILDGPPSHRLDYNRRVRDWVRQYATGPVRSGRAPIDAAHWQRRLSELAARHRVTGASLGILRIGTDGADEVVEAAHGVLNKDTGVEATSDSLFQIGSISKVWTATIAMQLVDEGRLDLDAPIATVLPDLQLSDPDVTKQVTMRHLLTHTSGIDGDVFTDTGRGDDCLQRYAGLLGDVAMNHPLGATWSYCNAGFSLAGRVIEVLTDGTWDAALRQRVFTPLGLSHAVTLPEEALLYRAAVGHVAEGDGEPTRAPVWGLPRSLGPAGLISATATDVLGFARMHLTGGLAPDGTRVLSAESAAAMASKQADLPDKYTLGDSWGIGWIRYDWGGRRLIGHDGNTIGQAAILRLFPDEGLAVTLLTNGGNTRDLYEELYREIFAELADVAMPRALTPPAEPVTVDITAHLGTYERASVKMEVLAGTDAPVLRTTLTGPLAALMTDPVEEHPLVAVADNLFVVREPGAQTWTPVTFYQLPTGERYVHFGARATPKVA